MNKEIQDLNEIKIGKLTLNEKSKVYGGQLAKAGGQADCPDSNTCACSCPK